MMNRRKRLARSRQWGTSLGNIRWADPSAKRTYDLLRRNCTRGNFETTRFREGGYMVSENNKNKITPSSRHRRKFEIAAEHRISRRDTYLLNSLSLNSRLLRNNKARRSRRSALIDVAHCATRLRRSLSDSCIHRIKNFHRKCRPRGALVGGAERSPPLRLIT